MRYCSLNDPALSTEWSKDIWAIIQEPYFFPYMQLLMKVRRLLVISYS